METKELKRESTIHLTNNTQLMQLCRTNRPYLWQHVLMVLCWISCMLQSQLLEPVLTPTTKNS